MSASRPGPTAYVAAVTSLPYALPFAAGFALVLWGALELVPILTTGSGILPALFETLLILTAGSLLVFFGAAGALAQVLGAVAEDRRASE